MIDYAKVGGRIKGFRNAAHLTQEQLAEIVLVDHNHISSIENGRKIPSLELIILIANALKVSTDDLLVDSVEHAHSVNGDEIHTLLLDCNDVEKKMLIKALHFLKALLSEFGI